MTHVVNLLPRRDLRRRQRLRYVLLLTIGIVLLGGMGLLVSRTARLQRDFGDASRRPTRSCSPRLSSASRRCVRRGSSINGSASSTSADRRSPPGNPAAGAGGRSARAGVADAAGVPGVLRWTALNLQALTSVEAALTRVADSRRQSRRDPARRRGALAVQFFPDGSAR